MDTQETKKECVHVKTQEEWDYVIGKVRLEYYNSFFRHMERTCIVISDCCKGNFYNLDYFEREKFTILTFDEFKQRYEPTEVKENNLFGITSDKVVQSVMNDLNERSKVGIAKYNQTLEREDLRLKDWLQHAYEETLDKANYLKRAIIELEKQNNDN